jgi:hypothetical protein
MIAIERSELETNYILQEGQHVIACEKRDLLLYVEPDSTLGQDLPPKNPFI